MFVFMIQKTTNHFLNIKEYIDILLKNQVKTDNQDIRSGLFLKQKLEKNINIMTA